MAKIPKFKDEIEESEFWDTHDFTDYFDDMEDVDVKFVDMRPKLLISMRMEAGTIAELKAFAAERGLGYQTLIRMWVMERLKHEKTRAQEKGKQAVG